MTTQNNIARMHAKRMLAENKQELEILYQIIKSHCRVIDTECLLHIKTAIYHLENAISELRD